jgi:hypothetical protein
MLSVEKCIIDERFFFFIGNSRSHSDAQDMSDLEETIDTKLCNIILSIHLRKEYVSVERVDASIHEISKH